MANFEILCQSDFFTFFIGTQKDVFNIHATVLQDLSQPLHSLVTNIFLKEAREKNAYLPGENAETFTRFMEWAYTRSYRVRKNGRIMSRDTSTEAVAKHSTEKMPYGTILTFCCTSCGNWFDVNKSVENERSSFPFCIRCTAYHRCVGCGTKIRAQENGTCACKACSQKFDIDPVDLRATSSHHFKIFRSREYPVAEASHTDVRDFLNASIPPDEVSQDLLIHAKVFVFADKWLISALKELALHKLHRDICEYQVSEDEGAEIVKLLGYCFAITISGGVVENDNESERNDETFRELKELVCAYAACKSEQLLRYTQFRKLLRQSGVVALHLIDAVNCRFSQPPCRFQDDDQDAATS